MALPHSSRCKFVFSASLLVAVALGFAVTPLAAQQPQTSGDDVIHIDTAVVSSINDIDVPARVKGFIQTLHVEEGDDVELDQALAQLDTAQVESELEAARIRAANAQRQADDQTPLKYAQATLDVAEKELEISVGLSNRDALPAQELERTRLSKIQAELQVQRSEAQMAIDQGQVDLEKQAVISVEELKRRHTILAPIAGQVISINRRAGEYVQEGETLLRVVDLSSVKVEGTIPRSRANPDQLMAKAVVIRLRLANDEVIAFDGTVKSIGLNNLEQDTYKIQAVIENEKRGGEWLLRPNLSVEMDVKL